MTEAIDLRASQGREITNVYVFTNGMVMVFDQFGQQMPEYQGFREEVIDKIKADFDGPIEEGVRWIRLPHQGSGPLGIKEGLC